jgi:integrase
METINKREAWNKGKLVGQKPPLKPKDIWAIRIHLQNAHAVRDLAMFNLAIDSKFGAAISSACGCATSPTETRCSRAMVIQRKTQRPVQFELTEPTRRQCRPGWRSHVCARSVPVPEQSGKVAPCLDTPICADRASLGRRCRVDSSAYGTHSMRRTKATLIYKRTKNLRAVQLLLGHSKLESTVRYLGIEVDDALEISEQTEI